MTEIPADTTTPADATPLSVVHLCAPAEVGGLETVVQGVAEAQRAHGHTVRVVAVIEPGVDHGAFSRPLEEAGVDLTILELPARAYLREVRRVRSLLRAWRPDVLHTHGYRSDLLHGWSARQLGVATVSTLHGFSMRGGRSSLLEQVQQRMIGRFDAVIAVSAPIARAVGRLGVAPDRLHVVPNAWKPPRERLQRGEARQRLDVRPEDLCIGWVGRLFPIKGPDVLLRALGRLEAGGWTARIVGDGPQRAEVEALVDELGLADRVRLCGSIPDASRLFAGLDLLVLSSRSEGTPMVLLEAMGAGIPVVASRVGGIPDVLSAPDEGWLVPSEDPAALSDAIADALGDVDRRADVAAAARRRLEREFDLDTWVERHDHVYRAALAIASDR